MTQAPETLQSTSQEAVTGTATGSASAVLRSPLSYITFDSNGVSTGTGFTPDGTLPPGALACAAEETVNWQSWANVGGVLTATAAPALTPVQQAFKALAAGITVTFTGSLTYTTTFLTDSASMSNWMKLATVVNTTGAFPGGATSWDMSDSTGVWHTFTLSQWKAVAGALALFDAQCLQIIAGHPSVTLPPSTITLGV